jgi:hypothetical protein
MDFVPRYQRLRNVPERATYIWIFDRSLKIIRHPSGLEMSHMKIDKA